DDDGSTLGENLIGAAGPRAEVAAGLTALCRHSQLVSPEDLKIVEHLSADPVPGVRFQVAYRILTLYKTEPSLMWQIIRRICREETYCPIILTVVQGALAQMRRLHTEEVLGLVDVLLHRTFHGSHATNVRQACFTMLGSLFISTGNAS